MMEERIRKDIENRVARLEQQVRAFKTLHESELAMILDELTAFRAELAAAATPSDVPAAPLSDPAANSPKRAAWLAAQQKKDEERRAPLSRRELLRGSRDEEKSG